MINPFETLFRNSFWNNLIFLNRNKFYGAYELREQYSRRMSRGLIIAILLFVILILSPRILDIFQNFIHPENEVVLEEHEITLSQAPDGNLGMENLPPIQKSEKVIKNQSKIEKSTKDIINPKIKKDETPQESKEKIQDSKQQSNQNAAEVKSDQSNAGTNSGSSNSKGDSSNSNQIYKFVSHMPVFAGCDEQNTSYSEKKKCSDQRLLGFLKSNIKYPPQAIRNKTEGIVLIQFIVEKNGSISNIKILREIGDGCGAETMRVLELINSLKLLWSPGYQGSAPVRVQYTLPVEFEGL